MPSAPPSSSAVLDGVALPLATALLGVGVAWLDPRPAALALAVLLLAVGAAGTWAAFRRRRLQALNERLVAEHRMLRESVENNPMPFAVYDDQDRLIAWNKSYEATHAEAFRRLRPQIAEGWLTYGELIRVTAEATLPPEEVAAHVAERVRRQREADGAGVDREYPGLGWLRVCKFQTPSGAVAGFAVDINELKQREAALQAQIALSEQLARQLRELADTDALTGVRSRRALLERAAAEFQRARRYGHPLCVAMLDIDDFKAVNDRHGHGAGDQVLERVAAVCLAQLRSCAAAPTTAGDWVARSSRSCCPKPRSPVRRRWPSACATPSASWPSTPAARPSGSASAWAWRRCRPPTTASRRCSPAPTLRCTAPRPPAATA